MSSTASIEPELRVSTGYHPRWFQQQIHDELKRFNVLVLHRRAGKTVLAVNQLIHGALTCTLSMGRFGYIAPYRNQAKLIAWDYVKVFTRHLTLADGSPLCDYNEAELKVTFRHNGATISLFGADNPDSIRGAYFDGVVMDEVAQMKPTIWGEIVRPMLADRRGWIVFIGTPKGINLFYELYLQAVSDPRWYAKVLTVDDTGALEAEEIADMKADMPSENVIRQELYCDFSASTDDTLITVDMIREAQAVVLRESQYDWAPKLIGVDVARHGDDNTVIIRRQGLACWEPSIFKPRNPKTYEMDLASEVANIAGGWGGVDGIFFDVSGGYGGGAHDRLVQLGFDNVFEVHFGGESSRPQYRNKRTEMYFVGRDWLKAGGYLPKNQRLTRDLAAVLFDYEPQTNKIFLEPKKAIKKRLGFSPDFGDAWACTFAYPVAPRDSGLLENARETLQPQTEYNPVEDMFRDEDVWID